LVHETETGQRMKNTTVIYCSECTASSCPLLGQFSRRDPELVSLSTLNFFLHVLKDGVGDIVDENSSIFMLQVCSSCHLQGHAGCKTLFKENPPFLSRGCWLTQVVLYNGHKNGCFRRQALASVKQVSVLPVTQPLVSKH